MATYGLLHGSNQGGWIWQPTANRLRAAGHQVYAPSLDGCGERKGQMRPGISAETQADEVAQLMFYEDLKDVVLVGTSNQWVIKQALDTGVYGLVLPHLSTVEDAQAAVAAARYPQVPGVQDFEPVGERGWGNRIASRYWGLIPQEYYDAADLWPLDPDGDVLLIGIVEDAEGVKNIRDIVRDARGIGAIWAGSGDMSVSMGLPGNASHPTVQENVLRVLAACKEFDVPCATVATADDVAMRLEQGFRIIMTSPVRSTPGLTEGRRFAAQ
jgi:4-hydroxy-2-oxoheptanedioate aldolase